MIIVPEFIIHSLLEKYLNRVRKEYVDAVDKQKTFLYKLLTNVSFQRLTYIEQAVEIFVTRDKSSSNYLEIDLGFNIQKNSFPTVSVVLSSETSGQNFLGNGTETEVNYDETTKEQTMLFVERQNATCDLIIASKSTNETTLIYHFLRAILKVARPAFTITGVENMKFSGQDLSPYRELAPQGIYTKVLRLSFEYESKIPDLDITVFKEEISFCLTLEN